MSCKCDTINIINDNNIIVVSHADGRDGKSAYLQAVEGGYREDYPEIFELKENEQV